GARPAATPPLAGRCLVQCAALPDRRRAAAAQLSPRGAHRHRGRRLPRRRRGGAHGRWPVTAAFGLPILWAVFLAALITALATGLGAVPAPSCAASPPAG